MLSPRQKVLYKLSNQPMPFPILLNLVILAPMNCRVWKHLHQLMQNQFTSVYIYFQNKNIISQNKYCLNMLQVGTALILVTFTVFNLSNLINCLGKSQFLGCLYEGFPVTNFLKDYFPLGTMKGTPMSIKYHASGSKTPCLNIWSLLKKQLWDNCLNHSELRLPCSEQYELELSNTGPFAWKCAQGPRVRHNFATKPQQKECCL